MVKINRDYVLKTFLDKVREAKRQGMSEIKVPVRFLDDLAYIVYQLMSEEISKAYNAIEAKPKEEVKPQLPINRKVLKEITPKKLDTILPKEEKEETIKVTVPNGLNEKSEPVTYTTEVQLSKVEEAVKEIEEKKNEEIVVNDIEKEDEEDDDNTNIMYGGTW